MNFKLKAQLLPEKQFIHTKIARINALRGNARSTISTLRGMRLGDQHG